MHRYRVYGVSEYLRVYVIRQVNGGIDPRAAMLVQQRATDDVREHRHRNLTTFRSLHNTLIDGCVLM